MQIFLRDTRSDMRPLLCLTIEQPIGYCTAVRHYQRYEYIICRHQNVPSSGGARRRLDLYATPERDPFLSPVVPPSAPGGSYHRLRGSAAPMESPHYGGGYVTEGTPHYLRRARHEQREVEEEARLRERFAESAAQLTSQADVIADLTDEAQMLRCTSSDTL